MQNFKKNVNGITLMALVVTIIILLILAGISIGMLSGDNSIINQAGNAKAQTDIAGEKEIIDLAVVHAMGKSKYKDIDETYFTNELEKSNATVTKSGSKYKVSFSSGRQYTVDSDGNIKEKKVLDNSKLNEKEIIALQTNNIEEIAEDEIDNAIIANNKNIRGVLTGDVPIPNGFYYVGGTKDEGVVISDSASDSGRGTSHEVISNFAGNQFVWVPVDNSNDFIRYQYYYNKQPIAITSYYEPSQTSYQYSTEVAEYSAMYNSVTENKGFYVARYEASSNNNSSSGNANSQGNKTPWTNIAWGNNMTTIGTTGAVYKSQQMYTNKTTHGVTSTLIYGIQWDAIMAWIDPAYKTSTCTGDSYVANSEGKGYYKQADKTNTASDSNYAVKNIYDLAGNVREWTMEAFGTGSRVPRRRSL